MRKIARRFAIKPKSADDYVGRPEKPKTPLKQV